MNLNCMNGKLEKQFVAAVQNDLDHLEKLKKAYCLLQGTFKLTNLGGNDEWYGADEEKKFWKDMKKLGTSWQKRLKERGCDPDADPEELKEWEDDAQPSWYTVLLDTRFSKNWASESGVFIGIAFKNTFKFLKKHKIGWEYDGVEVSWR